MRTDVRKAEVQEANTRAEMQMILAELAFRQAKGPEWHAARDSRAFQLGLVG